MRKQSSLAQYLKHYILFEVPSVFLLANYSWSFFVNITSLRILVSDRGTAANQDILYSTLQENPIRQPHQHIALSIRISSSSYLN